MAVIEADRPRTKKEGQAFGGSTAVRVVEYRKSISREERWQYRKSRASCCGSWIFLIRHSEAKGCVPFVQKARSPRESSKPSYRPRVSGHARRAKSYQAAQTLHLRKRRRQFLFMVVFGIGILAGLDTFPPLTGNFGRRSCERIAGAMPEFSGNSDKWDGMSQWYGNANCIQNAQRRHE